jgi:hypothetical protein
MNRSSARIVEGHRRPDDAFVTRLRLPLSVAVAVCAALAPAGAASAASRTAYYDTLLLTHAKDGGLPNGASTGGVLSQDARIAKAAAFQSDASDLVSGDTNGATDVFVIQRAGGYGKLGTPWKPGPTRLISMGAGGKPANGPSWGPAISGDASTSKGSDSTPPNCVAFVSRASNLVAGDTNGKADAFVWWFASGKIERVSVSSAGGQSNGDSFDVAVDGTCERIAFTSTATNIAQTTSGGAKTPNFGAVKTAKPSAGVRQVYVHVPRAERPTDKGLVGLTYLASASDKGTPGNGDSYDPSLSLRTSQVLAFTSKATNLDTRDRTAATDVYVKAMRRIQKRYGSKGKRQKLATLRTALRVVSVNARGTTGNGASLEGRASDQSCFVIFRTDATNVLRGDSSNMSDIVRADLRGFLRKKKILDVDPDGCSQVAGAKGPSGNTIRVDEVARGDGPSTDPQVAGGGNYVTFTSSSNTFPGVTGADDDTNGVKDAFLWTGVRHLIRTISANDQNNPLNGAAGDAFPSQRINYLLFETEDPLADRDRIGARSAADDSGGLVKLPALNQIYMRYLGPMVVPSTG